MEEMNLMLVLLFWLSMAVNGYAAVRSFRRPPHTLSLLAPWAGVATGLAYFVLSSPYFARTDVSLSVPIRVDLVLLPPLILISSIAAILNLCRGQKKGMS